MVGPHLSRGECEEQALGHGPADVQVQCPQPGCAALLCKLHHPAGRAAPWGTAQGTATAPQHPAAPRRYLSQRARRQRQAGWPERRSSVHWWGSSRARPRPSARSSGSTAMLQHCLVSSPRDSAVGGSGQSPAVAWRPMGWWVGWGLTVTAVLARHGALQGGKPSVSPRSDGGDGCQPEASTRRSPSPAPPGCASAAQPRPTQPALTREQQEQQHRAQLCELHAASRVSRPTALLFCRLPRGSQLLLRQPQRPHFLSATPFLWVAM